MTEARFPDSADNSSRKTESKDTLGLAPELSLLDAITRFIRTYIVIETEAAWTLALWVLHTHAEKAADITPYICLTSPAPRCGKTNLLTLLSLLVREPLPTSDISTACVYRAITERQPTLLIDEADTVFERREDLRGILNSGYSRHCALVQRCDGDDHQVKDFSTWGPKLIAKIGPLPRTLRDRSILIEMRRKEAGRVVQRFRLRRVIAEAEKLADGGRTWALANTAKLLSVEPDEIDGLSDRAQDIWDPLLAIAQFVGGEWPGRALRAALRLSGACLAGELGPEVQVIRDIWQSFEEARVDRLFTVRLLARLQSLEESPWRSWKRGRPLSAYDLALLVRPFGIAPGTIRTAEGTRKGYYRADFDDAYRRYVPQDPSQPSRRHERSQVPGHQAPASTSGVVTGESQFPSQSELTSDEPSRLSSAGIDINPCSTRAQSTSPEFEPPNETHGEPSCGVGSQAESTDPGKQPEEPERRSG